MSSDPNHSVSFVEEYPDRQAEVERQRARRNPEPEDKILSREEAAEFLNISVSGLDRHVRSEAIPFVRLGGRVLFRKSSLERYLREKEILPDGFESHFSPEQVASIREQTEAMQRSARIIDLSKIIRKSAQIQLNKRRWQAMSEAEKAEVESLVTTAGNELQALYMDEDILKQKQLDRLRAKLGIKG